VEILYLLIPLSVALVAVIVVAFLWAIRSGQFDDLEGPAHRILLDDDERAEGPIHDRKTTTVDLNQWPTGIAARDGLL
jgi:cbb3-type cytochrome oxidase maturation protein